MTSCAISTIHYISHYVNVNQTYDLPFDNIKFIVDIQEALTNDNIVTIECNIYRESETLKFQNIILESLSKIKCKSNINKTFKINSVQSNTRGIILSSENISMLEKFLQQNQFINNLAMNYINIKDGKSLNNLLINNKQIKHVALIAYDNTYSEIFANVQLELLKITADLTNSKTYNDMAMLLLFPHIKSIVLCTNIHVTLWDRPLTTESDAYKSLNDAFTRTKSLVQLKFIIHQIKDVSLTNCFFSSKNKSIEVLELYSQYNYQDDDVYENAYQPIINFIIENNTLRHIKANCYNIHMANALVFNKSVVKLELDEYEAQYGNIYYFDSIRKLILKNKIIISLSFKNRVHSEFSHLIKNIYESLLQNNIITHLTLSNSEHKSNHILLDVITTNKIIENVTFQQSCVDPTELKLIEQASNNKADRIQILKDCLILYATHEIIPMINIINSYSEWIDINSLI